MRIVSLVLVFAVSVFSRAHADELVFYTFESAFAAAPVQKVVEGPFKLYFGPQATPDIAEKAEPDTYDRSVDYPRFYRDETKEGCYAALARTLTVMIEEARKRDYDAIVNIRGSIGKGKSYDSTGFECRAGKGTTAVQLISQFAVTRMAANRAEELERDPALRTRAQRTKPPSKNVITLSLEEVLTSAEAEKVLGSIRVHWGSYGAPAYAERYADEYDEDGKINQFGREGACKQAVLRALASMVEDARERGFNGITRIRSYLDEQPVANDAEYECNIGFRSASVNLLASLVKLK